MIALNQGGCCIAGNWLWRELSFAVNPGEIVAVVGPNGCGKTTLARVLTGLRALSEGQLVAPAAIGYVPQISELRTPFRVEEVVQLGRARAARRFGRLDSADAARVESAIAAVGLTNRARQSFLQLSGGERQLTLIARALATDARILVLDEPLSALDLANQRRMLDLFTALASCGNAIVFTTHQPQHALHCATHGLLLRPNAPHAFGPVDAVIADEPLSATYDVPVRVIELSGPNGASRHVIPFN